MVLLDPAAINFIVLFSGMVTFPVHVHDPAGTLIVSPLWATVMQAEISVLEQFAAYHVGLDPEQTAKAMLGTDSKIITNRRISISKPPRTKILIWSSQKICLERALHNSEN